MTCSSCQEYCGFKDEPACYQYEGKTYCPTCMKVANRLYKLDVDDACRSKFTIPPKLFTKE
jgi:hypothetical protein